jgi:pimeloyl-ACP methyl ester carboxylesterase
MVISTPTASFNKMLLSDKHFEFEKGSVEGIPTLSCFNTDKKTGPRPLVFLSHAFQSSKEFWQDKLAFLAAAGYFAVAMDNKGHGERNGPDFKSQVFTKHGFNLYEVRRLIKETADDIPILIDHFITHKTIDAARIGMLGVSMGGFIAFRALVIEKRISVATPVIASPYFDETPRDVPLANRPEINRALEAYSQKYSPAGFAERFYPRAVLIQVGGRDKHLDAGRVEQFYKTLLPYYAKGPDKLRFIQEDNSGHDFTESMWQNVTKWFQKHL